MPFMPAASMTANARYGLQAESGERISSRVELALPGLYIGTRTSAERRALGIKPLPANLDEAIRVMEQSDLVAEALGEHVFDFFLRNKREEWSDYRRQVSRFELDRYLPML